MARLPSNYSRYVDELGRPTPEFWGWLNRTNTGTDWTAPTLLNGWTNTGTIYAPAAYRKTIGSRVELQGLITGGTPGQVAFILPAGFRPVNGAQIFPGTYEAIGIAPIFISPNGEVTPEGPSGTDISLDGISFSTP